MFPGFVGTTTMPAAATTVVGVDRNRDGIPDVLQGGFVGGFGGPAPFAAATVGAPYGVPAYGGSIGTRTMAAPAMTTMAAPFGATTVIGADRNRDGIPDVLQGGFVGGVGAPIGATYGVMQGGVVGGYGATGFAAPTVIGAAPTTIAPVMQGGFVGGYGTTGFAPPTVIGAAPTTIAPMVAPTITMGAPAVTTVAAPAMTTMAAPFGAATVIGADRNRDGIPDVLQGGFVGGFGGPAPVAAATVGAPYGVPAYGGFVGGFGGPAPVVGGFGTTTLPFGAGI